MAGGEQAVMCVLMLRGAQTPGELKQRGERIHAFAGLDEVHATLAGLIGRGLVARLARRPGQKEERYVQLLGQDAEVEGKAAGHSGNGTSISPPAPHEPPTPVAADADLQGRVAQLEREVAELRAVLIQP